MWLDEIEYGGKSRTNERQSRTLTLNIAIDVDGSWMEGTQKSRRNSSILLDNGVRGIYALLLFLNFICFPNKKKSLSFYKTHLMQSCEFNLVGNKNITLYVYELRFEV